MLAQYAVSQFILSRQAKGLSKRTIEWYRGILKRFSRHYTSLPKDSTTVEEFLASITAGDERRHGYYRALRCFYRFANKRFGYPNPMDTIEPPKRSHKNPHWLTPEQLYTLLAFPNTPKIKAALLFLLDTGARLGELSGIQIDDLTDTPWGHVVNIHGKTGARSVPISYETYHALMVNLPLGYSTARLGRLISQAVHQAGLAGGAHSLRHTFATLWEGDELVLQQIMGHAHLSTTKMYRHLRTRMLSQQHHQYSPLKTLLSSSKEMFML